MAWWNRGGADEAGEGATTGRGRRGRQVGALALVLLLGSAALYPALRAHVRAIGLLLHLVGREDPTGITNRFAFAVRERDGSLRAGDRQLRTRRYTPQGRAGAPGIVLLHGVHHRGIDEPRLVGFARSLARAGIDVLTPLLDELTHYRVVQSSIRDIDACAAAHARALGRASVGVTGISFAGGLALLAAARQDGKEPIGFVVTVGAHDDLERLARFYAGAPIRGPDGDPVATRPHPYGARVIVQAYAERFFAPPDLPAARTALEAYLHDDFRRARKQARTLSPAGQERMAVVLDHEREAELGQLLLEAVAANRSRLQQVSPHGQLTGLRVPVYLVHGASDPIIPSVETRWLTRQVPARWLKQSLISSVLRHAELPREPGLGEYLELVRFMGAVLREADDAPSR